MSDVAKEAEGARRFVGYSTTGGNGAMSALPDVDMLLVCIEYATLHAIARYYDVTANAVRNRLAQSGYAISEVHGVVTSVRRIPVRRETSRRIAGVLI